MLPAPLAFGEPSGNPDPPGSLCVCPLPWVLPLRPPRRAFLGLGDPPSLARAQQEGRLQGRVLMEFPSRHQGTASPRRLRSVRGRPPAGSRVQGGGPSRLPMGKQSRREVLSPLWPAAG